MTQNQLHCQPVLCWCAGIVQLLQLGQALTTQVESAVQAVRFGQPVALTSPGTDWYNAPAIDGYTTIAAGESQRGGQRGTTIVSPWKRGFNFTLSVDSGKTWQHSTLEFPGTHSRVQNFTTIVQGGFVRAVSPTTASGGGKGHTLGALPVWCNTCATPSPGLCDARAAAACPDLACNQTHSPLAINVSTSALLGLSVAVDCRQVGIRGLPRPLRPEFGLASGFTGPSGPVRLADGSLIMTWPIKFADSPEHRPPRPPPGQPPAKHRLRTTVPMSIVAVRSVDGGYLWDYVGTVASAEQLPWSWYGPNEHDIAVLGDGKTMLVVFRPDSDGFCPGAPAYRFFYQSYSSDGGLTWTSPRPISGVGCVRPRLLRLASGPLLLTGGRLCPNLVGNGTRFPAQSCAPTAGGAKGGNFVWINTDGMADAHDGRNGTEWEAHCVSDHHNNRWEGPPNWRFTNNTATQSYNSLQMLGPSSAAVFYEHGWGASLPSRQFMMRLDFETLTGP